MCLPTCIVPGGTWAGADVFLCASVGVFCLAKEKHINKIPPENLGTVPGLSCLCALGCSGESNQENVRNPKHHYF